MSPAQPDPREPSPGLLLTRFQTLYWVIGGRWGDASRSWRRWSEVCGPYLERSKAEGLVGRMREIHAGDPLVHFEVVRRDDAEAW